MDNYSHYKKQLEYYEYLERQRENPVDLTKENEGIRQFADVLFNKSRNNLDKDLSGIIFDGNDTIDMFCMLVELVLYGIDILTNGEHNLFELKESDDNMVEMLRSYFKSTGFDINVDEEIIEAEDINLYRDRTDYYCQITKRPPDFLCMKGWYVLKYRIIDNKKYSFDRLTSLDKFKAYFVSNQKKVFVFNFKLTK